MSPSASSHYKTTPHRQPSSPHDFSASRASQSVGGLSLTRGLARGTEIDPLHQIVEIEQIRKQRGRTPVCEYLRLWEEVKIDYDKVDSDDGDEDGGAGGEMDAKGGDSEKRATPSSRRLSAFEAHTRCKHTESHVRLKGQHTAEMKSTTNFGSDKVSHISLLFLFLIALVVLQQA